MAFEIIYSFYNRKEEGGYDVENPDKFTKKIGKFEEVSLDKLAQAVMMQLARRDIMVFDVEIFEFVKKKLNFKETKGGIIIKNKKFLLDGTNQAIIEEEEDTEDKPVQPPLVRQPGRIEIFDGDDMVIANLKKRGINVTAKKRYPIFEEKTVLQRVNIPGAGLTELPGYNYTIEDDTGRKVELNSIYFIPVTTGIGAEFNTELNRGPRLSYQNNSMVDPSMPVLRR